MPPRDDDTSRSHPEHAAAQEGGSVTTTLPVLHKQDYPPLDKEEIVQNNKTVRCKSLNSASSRKSLEESSSSPGHTPITMTKSKQQDDGTIIAHVEEAKKKKTKSELHSRQLRIALVVAVSGCLCVASFLAGSRFSTTLLVVIGGGGDRVEKKTKKEKEKPVMETTTFTPTMTTTMTVPTKTTVVPTIDATNSSCPAGATTTTRKKEEEEEEALLLSLRTRRRWALEQQWEEELTGTAVTTAAAAVVDHEYAESFVHPSMLSHEKGPSRVAILLGSSAVGDDDASVLREVLKHEGVEQVTVVGASYEEEKGGVSGAMMMSSNRRRTLRDRTRSSSYLRATADCTDLVGVSDLCTDDPRVTYVNRTVMEWFEDNKEEGYDVVFVTSRAHEEVPRDLCIPFWTFLLKTTLDDEGLVSTELGGVPFLADEDEDDDNNKTRAGGDDDRTTRREDIIDAVGKQGSEVVESVHVYEMAHRHSTSPRSFLVVSRNIDSRQNWYAPESVVNYLVHRRSVKTLSGKPVMRYFDGATMNLYSRPAKAWETSYCSDFPEDCKGGQWNPDVANFGAEHFEVKMSGVGDGNVGRGIFTKVDIPAGSYIMQREAVHNVKFPPHTTDVILELLDDMDVKEAQPVYDYIEGYGYETDSWGGVANLVDSSYATFMNHGCNGTYNYGSYEEDNKLETLTEENVVQSDLVVSTVTEFDPFDDRHMDHFGSSLEGAVRDIKAGEELFTNYLLFTAEKEEFEQTVNELRAMCRGEAVGLVVQVDTREERG